VDKSRVALITGSAKGLGVQIAKSLAEKGYSIVINYRNSEKEANKLVYHLKQTHGINALSIKGDVGILSDVKNMLKVIKEKLGNIDILVHNAGPFIHVDKTINDYKYDEWEYIINGNLNSYFYLIKEVIPFMRENNWGRIIALGFNQGNSNPGWKYRGAFAAAKSAVISLTKTLALEESKYNITANVISPGDIKGSFKELSINGVKKDSKKRNPTGFDIARVVTFLCEEDSDFISGSVIEVNGGIDILAKKNLKR